jgi:hypothetical protein
MSTYHNFTRRPKPLLSLPKPARLEGRYTNNELVPADPEYDSPEFICVHPPPGDGWIAFDNSSDERTGWLRFVEIDDDDGGAP